MCPSGSRNQLPLIDIDRLAVSATLPFCVKNLIHMLPNPQYSFVAVMQWELDSVGARSLPPGWDSQPASCSASGGTTEEGLPLTYVAQMPCMVMALQGRL